MSLNFNISKLAGKKILIAPLDWGLGHATRCIPLINSLLNSNCTIWLAGEGEQVVLLTKEFPQLPILTLKGYHVSYAAVGFAGKILWQIPKILKAIRHEHEWLKEQVKLYDFDVVISDNRYGLYHKNVHSIFITHQLFIKTPFGKWSDQVLQNWNYKFINRFTECWIPDWEGENNFAGQLSHPVKKPAIPVQYIGPLSRFQNNSDDYRPEHLLVILSGPEPQRSLLEKKILDQASTYTGTTIIVRGLPASTTFLESTDKIIFHNHLSAEKLNAEMGKAELIISRSGYSTIMDLAVMKKKSILIPTPGQPEQEYLAAYLMKKHFAFCVSQKEFSLPESIAQAKSFSYQLNT